MYTCPAKWKYCRGLTLIKVCGELTICSKGEHRVGALLQAKACVCCAKQSTVHPQGSYSFLTQPTHISFLLSCLYYATRPVAVRPNINCGLDT